ncbi:MAG: ribonuclease III [Clostridiales Family XIII bacterium]|jgi:ribonuclease-3|nr:ribonuclease III [Clostridiales Family XIII bacterium]
MQRTETLLEIQGLLGYDFEDRSLLALALTHSSYTNEIGGRHADSNERLEFLGDAVTGMGVTAMIFDRFPELAEGRMSAMRANLVKSDSLAEIARSLGLGAGLKFGVGADKTGIRENISVLEDAFEAVMGAVYIDGGAPAVKPVIQRLFSDRLEKLARTLESGSSIDDFKTMLQIEIQRSGVADIHYEMTSESGPDHDKLFHVTVRVGEKILGNGAGRTKKEAEKMAAKMALEELGCI